MNLEDCGKVACDRGHASESAPLILIVDDSPMNRDLMKRILRSDGFRTLAAADGFQALDMCSGTPIDLILLDVMMPGRDGFEVCTELKANAATREIPVIFLSALDDPESRVTGLSVGGLDYIGKPFDAAEVRARVRVHLKAHQEAQALARERSVTIEALREAQRSLLVRPEDLPGSNFAVYYQPLEAVGGDFYDVLELDEDTFGYFVADISGHGVGASFLTSAVKALLREYAAPPYSAEETVESINAALRATFSYGHHLTACYARLSRPERKLEVVSAGHPPLIYISRGGEGRSIQAGSDPLGMFGSVVLQKQEIAVSAGDRFYLYTDGLIEQRPGSAHACGLDGLVGACREHHNLPLDESVQAIIEGIRGKKSCDDLLLLGAEVRL